MNATFKIPSVEEPVASKSNKQDIEWESLELSSLPSVLAKQVQAIHEGETAIKKMKAQFAEQFNAAYSVDVPAGKVRLFSYKYDSVSFGNADPRKGNKPKVQFTARKGK